MTRNLKPSTPSAAPAFARRAARWALVFAHVVCPLLFFTNLTRNPYYTQIAMLNIFIVLCGFLWAFDVFQKKEWALPRLPTEWPMLGFLGAGVLSTVLTFVHHPLLRSGLAFETTRIWIFTIVNCLLTFYLPLLFTVPVAKSQRKLSIWSDILLASLWGICWFGFQSMKDPMPHPTFGNIWDFYGAILWVLAGVYMIIRTQNSEAVEFFHVIFSVTFLAGIYGVLQYFGRDMIWGSLIQPYGGRPVSTFGNPNFLSSYLMLVSPLAFVFALKAERSDAWGYLLIVLVSIVSVLCTLTRSTYIGLFAAYVLLGLFLFKKENAVWMKRLGLVMLVFIVLILIFPHTPLMKVQSPLARFTEVFEAMEKHQSYGPWHQRLLIWSSAWDMVKERPFFGKGWGAFELFYPFYQGKFLMTQLFPVWRTHANNAHNILMEMWAQLGFLGVGVSIWLFTVLFVGGYGIIRRKTDSLSRLVCIALLADLVGMVADNFFGNVSIFFAVPAFLFWWNMGALFNESDAPPSAPAPVPAWARSVALPAFMIFCVGSGYYFVRRWCQEVYYFQGFKEARGPQLEASIKSLEEAYEWFPGEVNSNYELGNSYARYARDLAQKNLPEESKKYVEKAIWAYKAALKANPGYDEIYFNLGVTEVQLGKTDDTLRHLETAVFINPLMREAYAALGNQYLATNELDKAVRLFEQGVKVFPNDKDMWNNLGVAYTKKGMDEKALVAHENSLKLAPGDPQAAANLNYVASRLHRNDPLLRVGPLMQELQELIKAQNYAAARKPAEELVKLVPEYPDGHLSLGNILFYLKDTTGAIRELKEAIRLRPDFTVAYVNLGHVYQYTGDPASARAAFQHALSIDSSNQEAKAALATLPPS